MKKALVFIIFGMSLLFNDISSQMIAPAYADGPYCAERTFKCRNYRDNGFVCCSTEDGSRCCHYKGSGDAYCADSCDW